MVSIKNFIHLAAKTTKFLFGTAYITRTHVISYLSKQSKKIKTGYEQKNFTILIIIITNDKQQLFLYYNFLQIAKLLPLRKVPF